MSIQTHAARDIAAGYMGDPDDPAYQIIYVTYADHLKEVERVRKEYESQDCYSSGLYGPTPCAQSERQRIVEAVKTLALYPIGSWESENEAVVLSEVLAAIKGENNE